MFHSILLHRILLATIYLWSSMKMRLLLVPYRTFEYQGQGVDNVHAFL